MNFDTMRIAVRLERSYLEEAFVIDPKLSTPYFISLLIDRGYIEDDNALPVLYTPVMVNDDNITLLADIINGKSRYKLPVVFVSKTFSNENPVDTTLLAKKLKGAAHVLVQEDKASNDRLKELCTQNNEYFGAIGIYYPNLSMGHKRYLYRGSEGIDKTLFEKVVRSVIQYGNSQMMDPLYTWFGVNNALLQDRLISQRQERVEAEMKRKSALYELLTIKQDLEQEKESMKQEAIVAAKEEADRILEDFDKDIQERDEEISRLSNELAKKEYEIIGLRSKLESVTAVPLIFMGEQDDFYPGEVKDFVLSAVKKEIENTEEKTRRRDVLEDIMKANGYQGTSEKRAAKAKRLLSNYTGMTPKLKHGLENIGYIFDPSDHEKAKYYGADRYTVIYASTPGDTKRGGKNNARTTIKKAF